MDALVDRKGPRAVAYLQFLYTDAAPEIIANSLNNFWGYVNPEAQALGNEAITMAVDRQSVGPSYGGFRKLSIWERLSPQAIP